MQRLRRIVVAVKDPAAKASPGIAKGAQLARAFGAELTLFHAITAPLYFDGKSPLPQEGLAEAERNVRRACRELLETSARRLRRAGVRVSVSAEWDYPAYEAVMREAARIDADLIVAERHAGSHAAANLLLHLTDWELLRQSRVPVLLIKRAGTYRRPVVLAALDPGRSHAKPARLDAKIVRIAAAITTALGGALHAVHAHVPLALAAFPYGTLAQETVARLEARAAAAAGHKLQRAVRTVALARSRCHVVGRLPADAIAQTATATRSSIVAMGAIARWGLKRLLIGSTAEKVLDRLSCDVLVVKPSHFAQRLPAARRGARHYSVPRARVMY